MSPAKQEKPKPENGDTTARPWDGVREHVDRVRSRPGVKFVLIGVITLALLVPAMLVWGLVEERSSRAERVATDIAQGWGASQTLNGPYLVLPYRITERINNKMTAVTRYAILSPEELTVESDVDVEERKKSIYRTQLYHLKATMKGAFDAAYLEEIKARGGVVNPDGAFLALGVSDMTGFRSDVMVSIAGAKAQKAEPGLRQIRHEGKRVQSSRAYTPDPVSPLLGGVHVPLAAEHLQTGFDFEVSLALNGSRDLGVIPAGRTTRYAIRSNWPHPGFDGKFLPEAREINEDGFTARWTVPNLARGIDGVHLESALPETEVAMQVSFVEPLQFYQIVSRTLKFSIGIFSLVFLAIFVLELTGRNPVHWIQYVLVGLSLVVFYVLLLALAEQVGFASAYLVSALATTGLISWYVGDALRGRNSTYVMGAVLSLTYLIMYLILNEDDYALLAGSV
ncbi:MAG: cell envelope integrity protein CreD, partial [Pseudomonadota bacterium]